MSSWVPPTHHLTRDVLQVWAANVEKATNGRVKFQMLPKHPSAPPGTFDAVRDGLVDVSFVTASYTPARHPLPLLGELPGAGATGEINSVAFSRIHWKYLQAANEYKGVKLLGVFTHGPGQIFTVSKPVRSVGDLAGWSAAAAASQLRPRCRRPRFQARVGLVRDLSSGIADGIFFPLESINRSISTRSSSTRPLPRRLLLLVIRLLHEQASGTSSRAGPGCDHVGLRASRWRGWQGVRGTPRCIGMESLKAANATIVGRRFVADVRKRTEPLVQGGSSPPPRKASTARRCTPSSTRS